MRTWRPTLFDVSGEDANAASRPDPATIPPSLQDLETPNAAQVQNGVIPPVNDSKEIKEAQRKSDPPSSLFDGDI